MKIAQMTWFHYNNYGTVLQAFALNNYLANQGHDVSIVNYIPRKDRDGITLPDNSIINSGIKKVKEKVVRMNHHLHESDDKKLKFKEFIANFSYTQECITYSDLMSLNSLYDAFICGSDQIWSPLNFDPHYFLDYVIDESKMISYAPSIGVSKINDKDIEDNIGRLVARFKHLSVREQEGVSVISKYANTEVYNCIDPTLLLDKLFWERYVVHELVVSEKYLLCYFLGGKKKHYSTAYNIARHLGLKVVIIPVFKEDFERNGTLNKSVGPLDFLGLVQNAEYVCTDSFHGVAYSLIFERQFTVFERFKKTSDKNQNSRIYSILSLVNLENRLYNSNIEKISSNQIDYEVVNSHLVANRKYSQDYLDKSLLSVNKTNRKVKIKYIGKEEDLCCGCGACSTVCPQNAISIAQNKSGFLTSTVNHSLCINCGICSNVCPFVGELEANSVRISKTYALKALKTEILMKSSSGGAGYLVAHELMKKDFSVIGCSLDSYTHQCHHIKLKTDEVDKLYLLQGSKYMQSDFSYAIKNIDLDSEPMVIFGTPCQIAGIRKIIQYKKIKKLIILVDLICHGVPSRNLWDQYKDYLRHRNQYTDGPINVTFRYKLKGWKERYIQIQSSNATICEHQNKNLYFRMFEACNAFSEACYECRWREKSAADLRIGDYWGPRFSNNTTGVSMVIAVTEVGNQLIKVLKECREADILDASIEDYYKYQQTINLPEPAYYDALMSELSDPNCSLEEIDHKYVAPIFVRKKICRQKDWLKKRIKHE